MKYNDYPDNIPTELIKKLNIEYENKNKCKTLQNETDSTANDTSTDNSQLQINNNYTELTYNQIISTAQTLVNALSQNIEYLNGYLSRTPNKSEQEILLRAINLLASNKNSLESSFNVTAQPPILSQGLTRRCLKQQILKLYYDILYYSILLFSQNASNFGLQSTSLNSLNSLFDFISITLLN